MGRQAWNRVFLVGFIAYVSIRGVFDRRTKRIEKAVTRMDSAERALLGLVGIGSLLVPVVYLFPPWLAFADYLLPAPAPWCGALLMLVALYLFWRSHADLAENWSVTLELRKGHRLVRNGVYRFVRHPMYASIF